MTAQTSTPRPVGLTVIAVLAVGQAALGIFWAIKWFYLAGQLGERGALLLPLAGALVFLRAVFATIISLLYLAFAGGALARRDWAWGVGMLAVILNLLGVVGLILSTDAIGQVVARAAAPIVILAYLVSSAGRTALGPAPQR